MRLFYNVLSFTHIFVMCSNVNIDEAFFDLYDTFANNTHESMQGCQTLDDTVHKDFGILQRSNGEQKESLELINNRQQTNLHTGIQTTSASNDSNGVPQVQAINPSVGNTNTSQISISTAISNSSNLQGIKHSKDQSEATDAKRPRKGESNASYQSVTDVHNSLELTDVWTNDCETQSQTYSHSPELSLDNETFDLLEKHLTDNPILTNFLDDFANQQLRSKPLDQTETFSQLQSERTKTSIIHQQRQHCGLKLCDYSAEVDLSQGTLPQMSGNEELTGNFAANAQLAEKDEKAPPSGLQYNTERQEHNILPLDFTIYYKENLDTITEARKHYIRHCIPLRRTLVIRDLGINNVLINKVFSSVLSEHSNKTDVEIFSNLMAQGIEPGLVNNLMKNKDAYRPQNTAKTKAHKLGEGVEKTFDSIFTKYSTCVKNIRSLSEYDEKQKEFFKFITEAFFEADYRNMYLKLKKDLWKLQLLWSEIYLYFLWRLKMTAEPQYTDAKTKYCILEELQCINDLLDTYYNDSDKEEIYTSVNTEDSPVYKYRELIIKILSSKQHADTIDKYLYLLANEIMRKNVKFNNPYANALAIIAFTSQVEKFPVLLGDLKRFYSIDSGIKKSSAAIAKLIDHISIVEKTAQIEILVALINFFAMMKGYKQDYLGLEFYAFFVNRVLIITWDDTQKQMSIGQISFDRVIYYLYNYIHVLFLE